MAECSRCGRALAASARFCGKCGAAADPAGPGPGSAATGAPSLLLVLPAGAPRELAAAAHDAAPSSQIVMVEAASAVARVQESLRHAANAGRPPDAVCLVGDDSHVPFARFGDRCGYDEAVLSDMPYGRRDTPDEEARYSGDVLSEVPVTRIPSLDAGLLHRLLRVGDGLRLGWADGVAVSAAAWEVASSAVLEEIGGAAAPPLMTAPPVGLPDVRGALREASGPLYFNVHGSDQEPAWYGEGSERDYSEVLRPEAVAVGADAVVATAACYGASLIERDGSMAPTFLRRGAGAFVGSTIIAWGLAPGMPPAYSDVIVREAFLGLAAGLPLGRALQHAKRVLLTETAEKDHGSPVIHNTLTAFVAYGAPSARCRVADRSSQSETRARRPTRPGRPSVLDAVRRRLSGVDDGADGSPLTAARSRLRGRLTPGSWRALTETQMALARATSRFAPRRRDEIGRALARLLERTDAPPRVRELRYRAGPNERTALFAEERQGPIQRRVALVLDARGAVITEASSR